MMNKRQRLDDGTVSNAAGLLPLLGLFLLMPPVATLFAHGAGLGGLPLLVIYIFGVWSALIICAALLAPRLHPDRMGEATPNGDSPLPDPS